MQSGHVKQQPVAKCCLVVIAMRHDMLGVPQ